MSLSDEPLPPEIAIVDRRLGLERRKGKAAASEPDDRRKSKDRRKQGERRRQVDPTTCEREYTDDEIIFMRAMDQYKRDNRRPFPTWSEVLEVLHALGYRKVAESAPLPGYAASIVPPKG